MNHRSQNRTGRGGFTLVELLVVIVIIAVLAALITAAVIPALGKANITKNRSEISQLEVAVENFKQRYGVYPPSRIKLSETGTYSSTLQLDIDSVQFLTTVWPRINLSAGVNWNGSGMIDPSPAGDWILEGDQCLVFFLGGIPLNVAGTTVPSCTGFSTNGANPAFHILMGGDTSPPAFEFSSSRLIYKTTSTPTFLHAAAPLFFSYLDTYGRADGSGLLLAGQPYAYFSSYKSRNGYNRYTPLSDCATLSVSPYFQAAGIPNQYLNPSTFQIISAGANMSFGSGGGPWTPATAPAVYPMGSPGYDDQSNFSSSLLGVGTE